MIVAHPKCRLHIERINDFCIITYFTYEALLTTEPAIYYMIPREFNNLLQLLREDSIGYVEKIGNGILVNMFVQVIPRRDLVL